MWVIGSESRVNKPTIRNVRIWWVQRKREKMEEEEKPINLNKWPSKDHILHLDSNKICNKQYYVGSALVAQWIKICCCHCSCLSLWHRFNPWPWKFWMLQEWQNKTKQNKTNKQKKRERENTISVTTDRNLMTYGNFLKKLKYSWFTMFPQFLLYNKVT